MEMIMVPPGFYDLPLFKRLTREEVESIGRLAQPMSFSKGELIFQERCSANYLDILWSGAVEIRKNDREGDARVITVIHAPGVIGEMSLMNGQQRSCSGVAVLDVSLYRIKRDDFMSEIEDGNLAAHKVVFNLAELMSTRLRLVDEKLVELLNQQDDVTVQVQGGDLSEFRKKLFSEWAF